MFASIVSRRGHRCANVYTTVFGWARALPMAARSKAHGTVSLLFARDAVLPAYICNNVKDMIQGKFCQKLKDATLHLKQFEPDNPWSNAAEREMKELKIGAGCSYCSPEHQSTCGMTP